MSGWHIAQMNVGVTVEATDHPQLADFMNQLDAINALADQAPGFVWRLQTEAGNATAIRPVDDDELPAIDLSSGIGAERQIGRTGRRLLYSSRPVCHAQCAAATGSGIGVLGSGGTDGFGGSGDAVDERVRAF